MKRKSTKVKAVATVMALSMSMMPMNTMAASQPKKNQYDVSMNEVVPYWNETADVSVNIGVDGNKVYIAVNVESADDTKRITGNAYLEKYSAGKWIKVKTWKISGKGHAELSKAYTGKAGIEYRVHVKGKSGAESFEEFSDGVEI